MTIKDKVKMCPFCEGSVALNADTCNYCGSSLSKTSTKSRTPYQTEDSLAGLYDPPYSPDKSSSRFGITAPEEKEEPEEVIKEEPKPQAKEKEDKEESSKLGSILLLSVGGQLFTLAWLLFFFSDQGKVSLEWKSGYWPIYLGLSALLIFQGWKKLSLRSE